MPAKLNRPGPRQRGCAVAVSKREPLALTWTSSVMKMPVTAIAITGPLTATRTVSPTLKWLLLAVLLVREGSSKSVRPPGANAPVLCLSA